MMKLILLLLTLSVLTVSCNSVKTPKGAIKTVKHASTDNSYKKTSGQMRGNTDTDTLIITYQVQSQSTFTYIQISSTTVLISHDKRLKKMDSLFCQPQDWETLTALLQTTDIDHLDQLKAPVSTDNNLAEAFLSVIRGDVATGTPLFKHGAPPKEVEPLINALLSTAKNAHKR